MLPWLPSFPPQAFPTTISSLTTPQSISLHSTEALALELLHVPQTSASSRCTFQGTCVPVQDMYGCSKDCLILIPFRLPHFSCFPLSLKCFSSASDSFSDVGIGPLLQFPHQQVGKVQSYRPRPVPHLTEFCMVLYVLFHWSGTPVHSQLVFCIYFCV